MADRRILWISPSSEDAFDQPIQEHIAPHVAHGFAVETVSMRRGPQHLEHQYYCALAIPDVLHRVKLAEKEGYDAAIIGGFYDLGLWEAREITEQLVVTAPAESCLHIATTLGQSFSIVVGRRFWIPKMKDNVARYGFLPRLASFEVLDLGVLELQASREETLERLLACGKSAIEDHLAEVIVLGCTIEYGFYRELQQELGVPVIDPVLATYKYTESLVELRDCFGWSHSKALAYKSPSPEEIRAWDLARQYSFEPDLWRYGGPADDRQ